ncbi:MAG: TolC family protein [Gemmatales bacterium]|nr:TolC family protein [Gemmatales bacterium]MDW8386910.1 TolC family protein [Gemmatales bacterium]
MNQLSARMLTWLGTAALFGALGCATYLPSTLPYAGICRPYLPPVLPPPPRSPETLPQPPAPEEQLPPPRREPAQPDEAPPKDDPQTEASAKPVRRLDEPLTLYEVLQSVQSSFPLLLAIQQERAIAAGQRLSAEGAFDLNLRLRGWSQDGTFESNRLDLGLEQPTPLYGTTFFGGYRFGFGEFPVYYGDRLTADGGEFRAGVQIPLLRDGPIDRRRAALRQAQIAESLADPLIQRARIDFLRDAAKLYWNWVAAGEQYRVAEQLLRLAEDRQAGFEEQFRRGQIAEFVVVDNRRLIFERQGALIAAERRLQQAAFDLSLFLRDAEGNPITPPASRLPRILLTEELPAPRSELLAQDIETAYRFRPELARFALLKEQATVDLRLAENQTWPALNAQVFGAQDVGKGKKETGIFALDRSVLEGSVVFEVPLQRREAQGRVRTAEAILMQLLAQERFTRDRISVEVQDAISNLDRTYQRWLRARDEQRVAQLVAELEFQRFQQGQSNLLEVNLRELTAAGAQAKVIDAAADYARALADYRAALGLDAVTDPSRDQVPPPGADWDFWSSLWPLGRCP